jgi:hypothetical protein
MRYYKDSQSYDAFSARLDMEALYHAELRHWISRHEFDSSSEPRIDCTLSLGSPFSSIDLPCGAEQYSSSCLEPGLPFSNRSQRLPSIATTSSLRCSWALSEV